MTKGLNIFIRLLLTIFMLTSCMQKNTSDVKETFKYWSGVEAPVDFELLNGQYWQSPHFTKEYIMYLKFKPTKEWWDNYLNYNSMSVDKKNWSVPNDAPAWFKPSENSVRYYASDNFVQGSRYFRDTITGIAFIYEIQL
jgi:hypothetical protein